MIETVADTAPREIERTGDDAPAGSLLAFIWRMSGRHQIAALCLAILVTGLGLVPLELQRRIFDDALAGDDLRLLYMLALIYAGVLILHQGLKFGLNLLQAWIGESAIFYMRNHLWRLHRESGASGRGDERPIVSILTTEVEKLGGFVGFGPGQMMANASMLVGTLAYTFFVEPGIAAIGLAFVLPQALLAPLMQKRLNLLVEKRLILMRRYSAVLGHDDPGEGIGRRKTQLYRNRISFFVWKFLLKGVMNLMNALAPLAILIVGGWLAIRGETSVGVIVSFVSGFSRLADPIRSLIGFYREASQANVYHRLIGGWMRRQIGEREG